MAKQSPMSGKSVVRERAAARLARPLREFLELEISGGVFLLGAVAAALIWANSPWSGHYDSLWGTHVQISAGPFSIDEDLRHWVNDGLMVIFFFVVGLEIKRELAVGDLSTWRQSALPVAAAVGGMVVPALFYFVLNPSGEPSRGWGIPMATDIALALGVLALLSRRIPSRLRVLLLSLAIVDDIGAVLVIAIFYTETIEVIALAAAGGAIVLMLGLRAIRVWWVPIYVVIGIVVWYATLESGVHATIAGVVLGLLAPARPLKKDALARSPIPQGEKNIDESVDAHDARVAKLRIVASVPVTERLAHVLHPWTSFFILPVFALANAGVSLAFGEIADAATSSIGWGIVVGLVVGKILGISVASYGALRLGAEIPEGVEFKHLVGMSALAGIGFTMSLFITGLAFGDPQLVADAKMGILFGSLLAALAGTLILSAVRPEPE